MASPGAVRGRGLLGLVAAMSHQPIFTPEDGANWHRAATHWKAIYEQVAGRLVELGEVEARLAKARAILAEGPTHPQYRQLVDAIDTALDLDPVPVLKADDHACWDDGETTCGCPQVTP